MFESSFEVIFHFFRFGLLRETHDGMLLMTIADWRASNGTRPDGSEVAFSSPSSD